MKVIQIEKEREKVAGILNGENSDRTTLNALTDFFYRINQHHPFEILKSYYLEFSSHLFSAITEASLGCADPDMLSQILDVLNKYEIIKDEIEPDDLHRCIHVINKMTVRVWFILGEWKRAVDVLEVITNESLGLENRRTLKSRLAKFSEPFECLDVVNTFFNESHSQSSRICQEIFDEWNQDYKGRKIDRAHLLLVENGMPHDLYKGSGVLLPLDLRVKQRPGDAEEDIIKFNNELLSANGAFTHALKDAVAAARTVAESRYGHEIQNRYFSLSLSVSDKQAAYTGGSLGATVAMLTYCGICNAFFRQTLSAPILESVVTGGVDMLGNLIPVGEKGLKQKVAAAFFSPVKRLMAPWKNMPSALQILESLKRKYPNRHLHIESAENLNQIIDDRNLIHSKPLILPRKVVSGVRRHGRRIAWVASFLVILILVIYLSSKGRLWKDRNPADFRIVGQYLVVNNVSGQEIWRYDFGFPLTNIYYKNPVENIKIKDTDRDGRNELLAGIYENDFPDYSGYFYHFNDNGDIIFQKKTGKKMTFGAVKYSGHYRITFLDAQDFNGDGKYEFITIAHQYPDFPCCVNVWDEEGSVLGEYWHSGQLNRADCFDLDGDGIKEIFALGQNNEYGCAVMAVLHPFDMDGASPQTAGGDYHASEMASGREIYFIRFPRSDIYHLLNGRDQAYQIQEQGNNLQVAIGNKLARNERSLDANNILYYYFNRDFMIQSITISDNYKMKFFQVTGERIDMSSVERKLRHTLFYDGEEWVEEPTMTKYWREKLGE